MQKFDQEEFNQFIIDQNIVGFFEEPIKFKSGRLCNCYINWRDAAKDVYLIDQLTDFVIAYIESLELKPESFYGVPEGATKLGVITQYKWAKKQPDYNSGAYALSMGRARPKDHGHPKDKYFVGVPKGRTIILEDIATTGGSLLQTIANLKELGVFPEAVIVLTDRKEKRNDGLSVKQVVEEMDILYYAMSDTIELLPKAYKKLQPDENVKKLVEDYYKQYGLEPVKLD